MMQDRDDDTKLERVARNIDTLLFGWRTTVVAVVVLLIALALYLL